MTRVYLVQAILSAFLSVLVRRLHAVLFVVTSLIVVIRIVVVREIVVLVLILILAHFFGILITHCLSPPILVFAFIGRIFVL